MATRIITDGKVYPYYTVIELASLLGLSLSGARRHIDKLNIQGTLIGKKNVYYISDIRSKHPRLFESMLLAMGINGVPVSTEEPEEAGYQDVAVPCQFY